jgi:hypothetical protein
VDRDGAEARATLEACQAAATQHPNVTLETSHEFLERDQLIVFLASNHINVLLYAPDRGLGGISSAGDWLLAAGRPFAVRRGKMFRHFAAANPSIYADDNPLQVILANGTAPVDHLRERWSPQSITAVYEEAVDRAISAMQHYPRDGNALRRRAGVWIDAETTARMRRLEEVSANADRLYQGLKAANGWGEAQIARQAAQELQIRDLEQKLSELDLKIRQLEEERNGLTAKNQLLQRQAVWSPLRYAMAITRRLRHST